VCEFGIPTAGSLPQDIVTGADGKLWFTENLGNKLGQITAAGIIIAEYTVPTPNSKPGGITLGSDGNLWFTESNAGKIGQFLLDQPLTATGTTLTATIGVEFASVVASFSDADPNPGPASSYAAVIDWGDSSATSTGGISATGGGNFDVSGSHTYAVAGSYTLTVTMTDNDMSHDIGGSTATAVSTANVSDPGGSGGSGASGGGNAPFYMPPPSFAPAPATSPKFLRDGSPSHMVPTAEFADSQPIVPSLAVGVFLTPDVGTLAGSAAFTLSHRSASTNLPEPPEWLSPAIVDLLAKNLLAGK
jgi:hypothetical protein